MRRTVFLLCVAGLFVAVPVSAQQVMRIVPRQPVVCHHDFHDRKEFIAPPRTLGNVLGRAKTATIEVDYVNFPEDGQVRAAFEYALSIWESELTSTVPIRIRAEWKSLRSGVLGEAIWGSAYANFGGEPHMNTFYPVALAEKLAGRELNAPDEPDIVASFNSNIDWYFGLDGNTPLGHMDFVTIVLHEIAHGLGFTHSFRVTGSSGTVGISAGANSAPLAFDLFVEDGGSRNLFRDFQAPSASIATALQSGELYFGIDLPERPRLFAPSKFSSGSSVAHLDEASYNDPADANRLMTPHISFAEAIHDPGDILRTVLGALGWTTTRILHTPLKDTERLDGAPYSVVVEVESDNGYDGITELHYTLDGTSFTTVVMTQQGASDRFVAQIPGTSQPRTYGYYITALDGGQRFSSPGQLQVQGQPAEQGLHFFTAGPDSRPPEIEHDPVTYIFDDEPVLVIEARVTDNLGVDNVSVSYRLNGGGLAVVDLQQITDDRYRGEVAFPDVVIGDEIEYRLTARDQSVGDNTTMSPENGMHVARVVGVLPTRDYYANNFDRPSEDFFGNFRIETPPGFQNGAIHSDHPYDNGTGPNDESHYTYQLQIPIRLAETNATMRFDEIVLVEPGDNGSVFGDDGFYDYVIVEGSIDGGETWEPFISGYDSRARNIWLSQYNANIIDHVSLANGEPGLFHQRVIDMLANDAFTPGDEVLIRFRLFADQLANGWGWAVDNLVIQESEKDVTGVQTDFSAFAIYPVPARDVLTLEFPQHYSRPVFVSVVDAQGREVLSEGVEAVSPSHRLDVRALLPGVYFVKIASGKELDTRKFVKISR